MSFTNYPQLNLLSTSMGYLLHHWYIHINSFLLLFFHCLTVVERMRWFGHVKHGEEKTITQESDRAGGGLRPIVLVKKTCNKVVEDDMYEEAKHHSIYGRGQITVKATYITSNPKAKSGKLQTINQ